MFKSIGKGLFTNMELNYIVKVLCLMEMYEPMNRKFPIHLKQKGKKTDIGLFIYGRRTE